MRHADLCYLAEEQQTLANNLDNNKLITKFENRHGSSVWTVEGHDYLFSATEHYKGSVAEQVSLFVQRY